jgi:RIO kinase 1
LLSAGGDARTPRRLELELATALPEPLEEFYDFGLLTGEISEIKSGKEATAYMVGATDKLGSDFAVAKVYHDRTRRNFAAASVYQEGRVILKGQVERAVKKHTEFGRAAEDAMWVDHEFEWLSTLHYAGVDVPAPYYSNDRAILMEFIGDETGPAPLLQHAAIEREPAGELFLGLLRNIEGMLAQNCVHGDLSPFNILFHAGRAVIIDLPQCIDPRASSRAREMLGRDVANVARYFARHGIKFDAERHTSNLWRRFELGQL